MPSLVTRGRVRTAGLALGSVVFLCMSDAHAQTVYYGVALPSDKTTSACPDVTATAFKGTVATSASSEPSIVFANCAGAYCSNSCGSVPLWYDVDNDGVVDFGESFTTWTRHNGVEIYAAGGPIRGAFGWLDFDALPGDTFGTVTAIGQCYIRLGTGSGGEPATDEWTVDDTGVDCTDAGCIPFCIRAADLQ